MHIVWKHTAKEEFGYADTKDEDAMENLLKIAVYFQTLNVEEVTESPDIAVSWCELLRVIKEVEYNQWK